MSASPNPGAQATRPAIGPLPPLEALGLPQAHDALPLQREAATKARPLQALFAPLDVPPDAPLNAHLRKRLDVETPWDSALEADAEPPQAALPGPALPTPTLATPALPAAPTPDAPDTPDASDMAHDEAPSAHAVAPANALPAPSEAVNTATSTPPSADLLHTTQPEDWQRLYANALQRVQQPLALDMRGTLTRLAGLVLEAKGLRVSVGAQCHVLPPDKTPVLAEVVGFANDRAFLMPAGDVQGLSAGAAVAVTEARAPTPRLHDAALPPSAGQGLLCLPLGAGLLGRVVDSQGTPLDHQGPLGNVATLPIGRQSLNAMDRDPVRQCLDTGVRAINGLLTVGRGQRLGLFAGSGVGKSVLLGMMARYTQADVIVVGLIGERGREVKEFIEDILGADGRARSVVVAAPADAPPLLRMQGADYASAIAEHFRDQGQHVLLLMDSLTRYAMAQREIALAIGEPPATKGYPPSCFARLPQLVERSGNGLNGVGSITAFYTVLTEGDDQQDPIADAARAILDGHIVLSRALAESGHYPAIDIEQSASRVMHNVVPEPHLQLARRFRSSYSTYAKARDLVQLGAYAAGSDPALDEAIALHPRMVEFLQQGMHEAAPLDSVLPLLQAVTTPNG